MFEGRGKIHYGKKKEAMSRRVYLDAIPSVSQWRNRPVCCGRFFCYFNNFVEAFIKCANCVIAYASLLKGGRVMENMRCQAKCRNRPNTYQTE